MVWSVYQTAKLWNVRPSQLLDITDPYHAYCVDDVVAQWGTYVTNELEKIEGKSDKEVSRKRYNKLLALLQAPDSVRFRPLKKPEK